MWSSGSKVTDLSCGVCSSGSKVTPGVVCGAQVVR